MTSEIRCEEARDLAAEMALGTLAGDDRARLITHLASCSQCRGLVEELSVVADSLLLLAPEHEPPAGFENAFLAQFKSPARRSRLQWLATAAAVLVLIGGSAGTALWVTKSDRDLGSHYRHALEEANGKYFGVRPVHDEDRTKVGNLFVYEGDPSWAFLVMNGSVAGGEYRAEVVSTSGEASSLGTFTITSSDRTWGTDLGESLKEVGVLRFTSVHGDDLTVRIQSD